MTIAALKLVTIAGSQGRENDTLELLQGLGLAHIVGDDSNGGEGNPGLRTLEALTYLRDTGEQRRRQHPPLEVPLASVVEEVLANKRAREDKSDEIEIIRSHIRALRPWGDFHFPTLEEMGGYRLWFYRVPLSRFHQLRAIDLPWVAISHDNRAHSVVVIAKDEPSSSAIPFPRIHTGSESLSTLHRRLDTALTELEDLNSARIALTRWLLPLQESLDQTFDDEARNQARAQLHLAAECFFLTAWVPEQRLGELQQLATEHNLALYIRPPTATEEPPVLLENPRQLEGAAAVVRFFQLPGYASWDPTPVIFLSFALFFAMILADAGYAALLGGLLLLRWRALGRTASRRALRTLAATLVASSLAFGVLAGSYFGVAPPAHSLIGRLQCFDMNDFDTMMLLSLTVGVAHLVIANSLNARHQPRDFRRLPPWGWNLLIVGGFGAWLGQSHHIAHLPLAGFTAMGLGALLVLACSGEQPVHSWRDIPLRLRDGLIGLYGISKAFGDVLSYLRLFALGLSSASLAITFNQLASNARDAMPQGGELLFVLILLLGHGLNLILAVMSGVIHGLRLNLLEFYNWGIRGEGSPFKAFKKRGM